MTVIVIDVNQHIYYISHRCHTVLKSHQLHLSFHRELPDGIDLISTKGGKSKGWQDSKIYFGEPTSYIINMVKCVFMCSYSHAYSRSYTEIKGKGHVSYVCGSHVSFFLEHWK